MSTDKGNLTFVTNPAKTPSLSHANFDLLFEIQLTL